MRLTTDMVTCQFAQLKPVEPMSPSGSGRVKTCGRGLSGREDGGVGYAPHFRIVAMSGATPSIEIIRFRL